MKWNQKISEVFNLFNPFFCGALILKVIKQFNNDGRKDFNVSLIYLILPILLHDETRDLIYSRSTFDKILKENPNILVGFRDRVEDLINVSNNAVSILLLNKNLEMNENGFNVISRINESSITKFDEDIQKYFNKAIHLSKLFKKSKNAEKVYISWGIRP